MLRRYNQGDDLRRVHWRTTARVGELMVREGGDRDDPDRISTTVLLDAGGENTPLDELERAVEVAASVMAAAADESTAGVSGAYRILTTTGLDTGGQRGHENLQGVLIALAGVGPAQADPRDRFNNAVERLGRPDHDEVLIVVGAFGDRPPGSDVLEDLARSYSAVVVVLVGAAAPQTDDEIDARRQAEAERAGSHGVLELGARSAYETGGMSAAGVLMVPLPLGSSLASAWSLELEGPEIANAAIGERTVEGAVG